MHLDIATALNIVSTLAIVGALIFAALQVREVNTARRDQRFPSQCSISVRPQIVPYRAVHPTAHTSSDDTAVTAYSNEVVYAHLTALTH